MILFIEHSTVWQTLLSRLWDECYSFSVFKLSERKLSELKGGRWQWNLGLTLLEPLRSCEFFYAQNRCTWQMPSQNAKEQCFALCTPWLSALHWNLLVNRKRGRRWTQCGKKHGRRGGPATGKARLSSEERTVGPWSCSRSALSIGTVHR